MHLLKDLLKNLHDVIESHSTLNYIRHAEIVQAITIEIILALGSETPACFIAPISTEFAINSMADLCGQDHRYQIQVAVIIDNYGEENIPMIGEYQNQKGLAEIEADFQSVLNRNGFGIYGLEAAYFQGANYQGVTLEDRALAILFMRLLYEYSD